MSSTPVTWICLIRAIGGATHAKMSMAQLRDACRDAGFDDVRTVLATGNVLFSTALPEAEVVSVLDGIVAGHGLRNEIFLRSPEDLQAILAANPFPDVAVERPDRLIVSFMNTAPTQTAAAAIAGHDGPERIAILGRDVFIDYLDGISASKLTPVRLERLLGQSGTARNWNTVRKLVQAASG